MKPLNQSESRRHQLNSGAGAAGTAGSNSPGFSGGSAGAGGNSLTSPGSVNYSVTNSGTINGTQG